jgi:hypothetical protein
MAHHVEFVADPVAAVHITGLPGDGERLGAAVALDDGDVRRRALALVQQASLLANSLQSQHDLHLHVGTSLR